jgi:hypothetical protein
VVAAGALLTGPSPSAVRTRQRLTAAIGRLRGGAEEAGLRTGPVGAWVYANKPLLRIAAVTLAVLALVFWGQPTGKVILLLAGLLLVALALIEFLGQPPEPGPGPQRPSASTREAALDWPQIWPSGLKPPRRKRPTSRCRWLCSSGRRPAIDASAPLRS